MEKNYRRLATSGFTHDAGDCVPRPAAIAENSVQTAPFANSASPIGVTLSGPAPPLSWKTVNFLTCMGCGR